MKPAAWSIGEASAWPLKVTVPVLPSAIGPLLARLAVGATLVTAIVLPADPESPSLSVTDRLTTYVPLSSG